MTDTLIRGPHYLDSIWSVAIAALEAAEDALEALGKDFSDDELDAAADKRTLAIQAIIALPARNFEDMIAKLMASGIEDGNIRSDCDLTAIINEMCLLQDAALQRGRAMQESRS